LGIAEVCIQQNVVASLGGRELMGWPESNRPLSEYGSDQWPEHYLYNIPSNLTTVVENLE
jgi:hypothetical protein